MNRRTGTNRICAGLATAVLALALMGTAAEARKVSYEINGKRYTYDTNDPHQVESARKRIEAANAADAARAKAEAEKASMPLVSVFGSQAQKEAAEAKARLERVLAEQDAADAARRQERAAAKESQSRRASEDDQAQAPETDRDRTETARNAASARTEPAHVTRMDAPADSAATTGTQPMVKSVSFDVESGIKTIIMSDGSIQEEPFDTATIAKLAFEQDSSGSLSDFVNRIRKAAPEETTGSTQKADAHAPAAPRQP
ncbi:hypothetical protein [Microvirga thermotolerans]|uniref:Uncharacterized protein n=1 Tax=Microvirga thermotolerans TaxID=2651334 RepID=A0A5P9JXW8_9HYPH|nr:hypothetical protein [Microvirga thermotolerans]QFU16971.1 hypothetical protein GDR74_12485 [Microvirga thermotolerans]